MSDREPGWGDPFEDDDEAARARAARRREREERRRGRTRRSLGDRVAASLESARESVSAARRRSTEGSRPTAEPESPPPGEAGATPRQAAEAGSASTGDPDPGRGAAPPPPRGLQGRALPGRFSRFALRHRLLGAGAVLAGVLAVVAVIWLAGRGGGVPEQAVLVEEHPDVFSLTIPEGLARSQIADLVGEERRIRGSYRQATRKPPKGFNLRRYGASDAPNLEGFLFPATYELERRGSARDLVARQLQAFEDNLAQVNVREARKEANLTVYDLVIIASMIEREIAVPEERRLAAAVIYNRLREGGTLGIDATLRYELDNFETPLKQSELDADTPYNTHRRAGLPPTPIGNPGLASLKAAANPANSDAFFYVIKPGTCNEHLFTADPQEFEQAQAEYQAALEAEGGSPTEC